MTDYSPEVMKQAEDAAQWSNCARRAVGAVLIPQDGFTSISSCNAAPDEHPVASAPSCQGVCPRTLPGADYSSYNNCVSVHAEAAVLTGAGSRRARGATLYATSVPCWDCAKLIAFNQVAVVHTVVESRDTHRDPEKILAFLEECGVVVHAVHR